jgi:hypothetical protein
VDTVSLHKSHYHTQSCNACLIGVIK